MDTSNKERREFIKLGAMGAVAGIIMPKSVFAAGPAGEVSVLQPPLLGNLIYTADHEGRWSGKKDAHLPEIQKNGGVIQIKTNHTMDDYAHYIVKHMVFDENLQFIDETMFLPGDEEAVSEHATKGHSNKIYVLSVCNVHDSWLNNITL